MRNSTTNTKYMVPNVAKAISFEWQSTDCPRDCPALLPQCSCNLEHATNLSAIAA
jgi:hypothetical protein